MPLVFSNTQLPPTRSDFSKQSNAIPRSYSALAAVIPDEPAPIKHPSPARTGASSPAEPCPLPRMLTRRRLAFGRADAGADVLRRPLRAPVRVGVAGQPAIFGRERRGLTRVASPGEE